MRQNRASGKAFGAVSLLTALILGLVLTARTQAQSPQILGDILTTPQNYWNKTVVVKGHVVRVTPNSPGSKQGSYLFRDASGREITVMTSALPSAGQERTVTGTVGQEAPASMVPVLYEGAFPVTPGGPPATLNQPMPMTAAPGAMPYGMLGANTPRPPSAGRGFSAPVLIALVSVGALLGVALIVAFRRRRRLRRADRAAPGRRRAAR